MTNNSVKIGFLLGSPDINGGTYVIFEHASRMNRRGHGVSIITEEKIDPARYDWHPAAAELEWITFEFAQEQQFDFVIATWWQSAFLLEKLSASHYVYFVQSIESRFFEPEDSTNHDTSNNLILKLLCKSTYSYRLPIITEAQWIKKYLYENFNNTAWLVQNGIRKDIYKLRGKTISPRVQGRLRVLLEGSVDAFHKNIQKTTELCKKADVDEVWLLTPSRIDSYPGVDDVFSQVPIQLTPAIYRSCDVLVKLSYVEGMFGPPLEMFHCGGTSIVYDVTGYDEYIVHNQNSYVVKKDDEDEVVRCLQRLACDPDELNRLKNGAVLTAQDWPDWQNSSRQFEYALEEIYTKTKATNRAYLQRYTQYLMSDCQNRLIAKESHIFADREKGTGNDTESIDDFVQLYWHGGEGFNQENFKWAHYKSGQWTTISLETKISSSPFYIRIDPSIRIGIVLIDYIRIMTDGKKSQSVEYSNSLDWEKVEVCGTARIISKNNILMLESFGNDPQLVVPALDNITEKDRISIEVRVKEIGFGQALHELCPDLIRESLRPWQRFFLKVMNYPAASSGVSSKALNAPRGGEYNTCPPLAD